MEIETSEFGGQVVSLYAGDNLDRVPRSHRSMVTPAVREAFADPLKYFRHVASVANRSFPNMAKWLRALLKQKRWMLELARGSHRSLRQAGFFLLPPEGVTPAWIGVPTAFDPTYPPAMAQFYQLVGFVDWTGAELAGKFDRPDLKLTRRSTLAYFNYVGSEVDAKTTRIIGGSLCGDMMVCTADGRGGWWKHVTGEVVLHGSVPEFINWAFGELLDGGRPESDVVLRRKKKRGSS